MRKQRSESVGRRNAVDAVEKTVSGPSIVIGNKKKEINNFPLNKYEQHSFMADTFNQKTLSPNKRKG